MRSTISASLVALLLAACSEQPAPRPAPGDSSPLATRPSPASPTPPLPPSPAVDTMRKSAIDFSIALTPYKPANIRFGDYANRWVLIYYFSPTCGHCQHSYPRIREMRARYEPRGMAFLTIASGYSQLDDLAMFDQDLALDIPTFRDLDLAFAKGYGTGSVPLVLLVRPDGTFRLWNRSDDATLREIEMAIQTAIKGG